MIVTQEIAPTIQRVCDRLASEAGDRDIRFTVEGACEAFPHDPSRLHDAVYNLLSNTIPHLAQGNHIRLRLSESPGFAEVAVADVTLDAEVHPTQDPILSTTVEQVALDSQILTMVARVAESHDGAVLVASAPGMGTTFHLRFPVHREASARLDPRAVLNVVHRIATRLFAYRDVAHLLREVLASAMEAVGAEAGGIWLYEPRDEALVFQHGVGGAANELMGMRIPANKGIAGAVFQSGQPVLSMNATEDSRHIEVASDFLTRPLVTIPLRNMAGSVGVMQVLNKRDGGVFSADEDLVILETMASLAATAIGNAQLAEQARKAAVADAVGDIAHDIKGMMTPVEWWMGALEMLARDSQGALDRVAAVLPPDRSSDLATVRQLFDQIDQAVSSVRSSSQEAQDRSVEIADALKGKLREPVFVVASVARTAGRVCQQLKAMAQARSIHLSMEGSCAPFPHDRTHIFHAVYNLVLNALYHVPPGGSVTVALSEVDGWAEIAVVDTGKGMSDAVRRSLFTESAVSNTPGGTGLGSQVVARVARRHEGKVSVESTPGKGTTVRLRLPLERSEILPVE